jgi:PKD domain
MRGHFRSVAIDQRGLVAGAFIVDSFSDFARKQLRNRGIVCAAGVVLFAGCALAAPHERDQSSLVAARALGGSVGPVDSPAGSLSPMMAAVERLASQSSQPARTRSNLLLKLRLSASCFRSDLTPDEFDQLLRDTKLLPPGLQQPTPGDRFFSDTFAWLGDAGIGPSGTSRRAQLTYSFAADGTTWGLTCINPSAIGPSTLDATLTTAFGSLDRGREFIRSAIASWRRVSGLTYTEVADDGSPMDINPTRVASRGDIRIGGRGLGISGSTPLASNAFPSAMGFADCSGGDMFINTSYFTPAYFTWTANGFRFFRNTVAHEHGHGLGFRHSVPCDITKLMEPSINQAINLLSPDEIRAAGSNYGDRLSGNQAPFSAFNYGDLTQPSLRSVIEPDLSVNGGFVTINGNLIAQDDYFRFTLSSEQSVTVIAQPTGVSAPNGAQSINCSAVIEPPGHVNALAAGNLAVQVLNASAVPIASANANAPGFAESLTQTLPAGQYFVRVWDTGVGVDLANQRVQTYTLTIRPGSARAAPQAIAGINKRVLANTTCQFIGDHNSRPLEPGATIPSSGYAWDLDGDGTFENSGAQPTIVYVSNGLYPVTLRVTDSNGLTATDTINVTVFGAVTSVSSVTPASADQGATVSVAINGANFKRVTSATQVSVSGSGVSVTGTPVVNARGSRITGLSFVLSPGALPGLRDVTVTSPDGTGTGTGVFEVAGAPALAACCRGATCVLALAADCVGPNTRFVAAATSCNSPGDVASPCCKGDFNQSGAVSSLDIFDFLSAWFAVEPSADINGLGGVEVQDVFDYVAAWFATC